MREYKYTTSEKFLEWYVIQEFENSTAFKTKNQ